MSKKALIRQQCQQKRKNLSTEEKKSFSEKIRERLKKEFLDISGYIAFFAGMEDEVDLLPLTGAYCNTHRQKICFPRVSDAKTGKMEFFEVKSLDDLEKGNFGILEPKKSQKKIGSHQIKIFLVPAVGVDKNGNRIGMGKGFYDRYFSKNILGENHKKIGVIFGCQVVPEIVPDEFDIPVDFLITEGAG